MENLLDASTFLFFLVLIFQFQFGFSKNASYANVMKCIDNERQALMELRESFVDEESCLSSWRVGGYHDQDCCNWKGITCNKSSGHVEMLDLHNAHLGGLINQSIMHLEHLQYLDLCFNNFPGTPIPNFLGSLKNLRYLNLSNAGFGGEIPRHLGYLASLQHLDLSSSSSSSSLTDGLSSKNLEWIIGLSSLQSLDLSWVNLADSHDWLDSVNMLPSLLVLKLRGCQLVGTTVSSCNLSSSLVSLDLGENHFSTTFPSWLLKLPNRLSVLRLDSNDFQGPIPSNLGNLSSLTLLDLSGNKFNSSSISCSLFDQSSLISSINLGLNSLQGPIPSCLCNLTSLKLLNLTYNNFVGRIPSEIGFLRELVSLDLSFNQLKSSFPSSFAHLTKLEIFDFSNNRHSEDVGHNEVGESLPNGLGNLSSLRVLNLTNNQFIGELPSELGHLKQLSVLDLSFNSFKSSIPSSIGELKELIFLYLHQNQLYGTVPPALGELANLRELDISHNSLTGELSESHFLNLRSLKVLSLSQNLHLTLNLSSRWIPPFQLQGLSLDSVFIGTQFPNWVQTQTNLSLLSMINCSISGTIPEWFRTTRIKDLFLSGNNLHGTLIQFPTDMHVLDLSNNHLSGPIVVFDENSTNNSLGVLNLGKNNFTGHIPEYICNLSSLSILSLANNHLSGGIPLCFENFGDFGILNVLDLSNNSLSGHIPSALSKVQTLMFLHLNRNKLYGPIPTSLKNLIFLLILDLGENELTGSIPGWIGTEISCLRILRLQSNEFQGNIPADLCKLSLLQILNIAENNLVGQIPRCVNNLTKMVSNSKGSLYTFDTYTDTVSNFVKGAEYEYSTNILQYVRFISLSGNSLDGEIPNELMELEGLQCLNLSNNKLSGRIPEKISNLKDLESLDLSMNKLSGHIPPTLADIDTLSYLNLSFNNLSGRIPSGNHFDTLNNQSIYLGNFGLCGKPIAKTCPGDEPWISKGPVSDHQGKEDEFELSWLYAGTMPGFVAGFLAFFSLLYFKVSWRLAYNRFLEDLYYKVQ